MLLGIIQFTVIASDEENLAELAESAEESRDEAKAAAAEVTGSSGYEQAANEANTKMETSLAEISAVIDDVQVIIDEASDAISGIISAEDGNVTVKNSAVSEFESKYDEAVTAVNEAIIDVQEVIDQAAVVVKNANLAVDTAATAVVHAQDAMDIALAANDLYLGLLDKAESSIDAGLFAYIAQAERNAAAAWNAFVDMQNDALDKVYTAADKAEAAKKAADELFEAWREAVLLVDKAVAGTSLEDLNILRDRALFAAVDARDHAINAVLAANALLDIAANALDILDKTDLFSKLDGYKKELKDIYYSAQEAVEKLTVEKGVVIEAPSTAGLVAIDNTSNNSGNYDAGGGVRFTLNCPILQMLNDNNVKSITLHYADGDTRIVRRSGIGRTFNASRNISLNAKSGSIIISFVLTTGETVYYKLDGSLDQNNYWNFSSGGKKEEGQEKVVTEAYKYVLKGYTLRELGMLEASLKSIDSEILNRMQRQELDGLFDFFGSTWQWTEPEGGGGPDGGGPGGGGPGGGGPGGGGPGGGPDGGPGGTVGTGALLTPPIAITTLAAVAGTPAVDETVDVPDIPAPQAPAPDNGPQEDARVLSDDDTLVIDDAMIPYASAPNQATWALWNLILSIAGVVLAIMICIRILVARKKEDEEYGVDADSNDRNRMNTDSDERKKRGRLPLIVAIPVLALVAITIFILTQDMTAGMIMVDIWTIVHAVLFAAGLLSYIFAYKRDKDEQSDSRLAEGNA